MSAGTGRQPWRRVILFVGVALLVALGALIAMQFVRDPAYSNQAQIEALKKLNLPQSKAATTDWPQWRGPNRDGVSAETGLLKSWPADLLTGPRKLWEAKTGSGFSSVAVADGRAYTMFQDGNSEAVVCWDAETGKELWRFRYPARYTNRFGSGPRSTPTVDGDRVYTVGGEGKMHCLKARPATPTGEAVWSKDLLADFGAQNLEWGVSFSPLVEGDLVFVNPGGPDGNSIAALNKYDGKVKWKALDDQAGYSSPVAATIAGKRQVVFFTAEGPLGVAPDDGTLYWRYRWRTSHGVNAATPIVVGDYVFVSSGYNRGCVLLKVEADGDAMSAEGVYRHRDMANHFSSSVRYRDHLYGFNDTALTCLDFRTGERQWEHDGFRKGSLTVADGRLIILGEEGTLALAEATPEAYRQVSSLKFSDAQCWTVPVVANGRLYVRDQARLVCVDLRQNMPAR
jgi:outer membrane protein assembly factor BamB